MFSQSGDESTPFLHILPAKSGEHFSTFQHRLMLSLHERSHPRPPSPPQLPIPEIAPFGTLIQPHQQITSLLEAPMEIQPNLPEPETSHDAYSIPLTELEPKGVKTCVIGTNCVGVLSTEGQAGRVMLDFASAPEEAAADSWTSQDEELARQLRPQLEAEIPDFNRPPHGGGSTGIFGGLGGLGGLNTFRPLVTNQAREEIEPARIDLSELLKVSSVEWAPNEEYTHIAVLNSEILLVRRGQLFSWELGAKEVIPHPKSADFNGEEIVSISGAKTRASLITRSNRVATLYDMSITKHTDGIQGNHLIRMLCQPLTRISLPEGDFLTEVVVSETISCVLSNAGRVFWWGLIPSDRKTTSQNSNSSPPVRLGSLVSLKRGSNNRNGDLILNFSATKGATLGRLVSPSNTSGSEVSVEVLSGRKDENGKEVTWKLSDALYLEDEKQPPVLGKVLAINQSSAVVNTSQTPELSEGDIRLIAVSEIQVSSEEDNDDEESARTAVAAGIQRDPVCIVEPDRGGEKSGATVGFRCLSLTCHSQGPLLLLERVSDGQAFILNSLPSPKSPEVPTVYAGTCKNKNAWTNATLEEESTPSEIAGLRTRAKFATSLSTNTPVLLDTHGFIRPIQSFYRLCPPFWHLPLAFESLSLSLLSNGQREFHLILCHPRKTGILSHIEANDFERSKRFIDACIDLSESNSDPIFPPVKRAKVETKDKVFEPTELLERSCGNKNILHACILPADRKRKQKKKRKYAKLCFEEVRWNHYSNKSYKIHTVELEPGRTRTLSYLLSLPSLSRLMQTLLAQTDASGRTPFLLALTSQDLTAAEHILEFVERAPLRQQSYLYQNAIARPSSDGLSSLQALLFNAALPYGQFGLKTLLIATQPSHLPPHPKSLLAFFQKRYPSAYRCEAIATSASPISDESKVLVCPCTREAPPNRKAYGDRSYEKFHNSYRLSSNNLANRHLITFGNIWEMRRALCELNGTSLTTGAVNTMITFQLEVRAYHGEGLGLDNSWEKELKKQYSVYSRSVVDTESLRVTLFKRLMEVCPAIPGQENILSSLLHEKLLVQYLQDMTRLGTSGEMEESKLSFGAPLLSAPMVSGIHSSLFHGGSIGVLTGVAPAPVQTLRDSDCIEEKEEKVSIPSILEIVAGSWEVVSSALMSPGGETESGHADRDSFTFSLLVDTPDNLLAIFLRSLLSKLEELDPEKLSTVFMSGDPTGVLDGDSARTVFVVQRFIQSLVRLYNRSIASQKQFLIPEPALNADIPSPAPGHTVPIERRVTKVQYRIYRVLSSFRVLAVWEMILSARALCWPILVGNIKQYPKDFDASNLTGINLMSFNSQGVKGLEWHFHCESVHRASKQSSSLLQLPPEGMKLSTSDFGLVSGEKRGGSSGGKERSDYWGEGEGDGLESASDSEDAGSDSEAEAPAPAPEPEREEGEEGGSEDEDGENFVPMIAPHRAPLAVGSARVSWLTDAADQTAQQRGMGFYQHHETGTQLNSNSGAVVLARGFSRFLKSAVKLCLPDQDQVDLSGLDLPVLSLPPAADRQVTEGIPEILDPVFQWAARLLDLAENQIEIGARFDLEARYRRSRGGDELFEHQNRPVAQMPRSDPKQYTDYLLSLSQLEAGETLPVLDLSSYEHVAYILDAHLFFAHNWSKCSVFGRQSSLSSSAPPTGASELSNGRDQAFFLRQPSIIGSKYKHQLSTQPNFKIPLQRDIPLAQKPHLLKPEASYSTLFSAPTDTPASTPCDSSPTLLPSAPLTYPQLDEKRVSSPSKLSARDITTRWSRVIEAFSELFSQGGPGAEPDNFLFTRGGFAGRMARFHTLLNSIKNTGYYGGHLSITIDRSEILKDSLTKLFSLEWAWQQSLNVNFEGELGGGEGVVAGFYTALANALKSSDKMPPRTTALFHEPGKLPEQATFYAPAPTLLSTSNPLFVQRLSYYRAVGKFFGISIYYKQPIPFLLTRHVVKYILGRQISWHDVGFFNADLYEGFRRMLEHCQEESMSQESFHAIYMLNFEVTVNDTVCELKPGGKSTPVTPDNVQEYVRLYSMYLMVGCLKEELEELRKGFVTVIPTNFIRDLTAEDLQLILTGGSTVVSYSRLKRQTSISFSFGISTQDRTSFTENFYRLIRHMKNTQRQQLLYFATGSALLASDSAMLSVFVEEGDFDKLPTAATCGRTMRLPCYKDYRRLKKKVLEAIQCQDYAFS